MLVLERQQGDSGPHDDSRAALRARLADRILAYLPNPGDHLSAVPGLSFYRRDGYCPPVSALYEPSLSVVIQGRKRVSLGARTVEYGAGQYVLTSVDLPTIAQVLDGSQAYPFLSMTLKLDLATVKDVIAEIDLQGIEADGGRSGMAIGTMTADLLDAIVRLAALADVPREIPIMRRLALREIIYRLLVGPHGAQLRHTVTSGTQCNRIANVIGWLREHYAEPIEISDLAQIAAMGVSTLHHHFKGVTQMSPLQYQKRLRLHEARRLLLIEPVDVSTAAFRVGYDSVTQFSREYKRLFGNPPARDIVHLRGR